MPACGREEVRTKLGAARTRLLLDRPFIGALVMHLQLTAADSSWCATTATDARALYYNADFIARLSLAQTQFILAHEALHCALSHFARRSHRELRRWDIACDHAVNLLLADEGLELLPGVLADTAYRGLAAEEIYPLISPSTRERSIDLHIFSDAQAGATGTAASAGAVRERESARQRRQAENGGIAGAAGNEIPSGAGRRPRPPATSERERLRQVWESRLIVAAQRARYANQLGSSWSRVIDGLLQPRLPWRALLARYMMSAARDDYSYRRLSRRDGDALLPQLRNDEIDLHVALDTSGSINDDELREFAGEIEALKGQVPARVTLYACDEALDTRGPWRFEAWEAIVLPERPRGGGGTSFRPVFEWIAEHHLRPDLLVYFTDAEGAFPAQMPAYPVIWLVKGAAQVPWGERIQLN